MAPRLTQDGPTEQESRLTEIVRADPLMMRLLNAVRSIALPDWAIGGGTVRSLVWDALHEHAERTEAPDVDVLYFDANDLSKDTELAAEKDLTALVPEVEWDVKNQARVHLWRSIPASSSTLNGLLTWSEPATAVAIRLLDDDGLEILAPYGLDDLFDMVFRPTDHIPFDEYLERVEKKALTSRWPRVTVVTEVPPEGP